MGSIWLNDVMERMDGDIFDYVRKYLPPYLVPAQKEQLFEELKKFPGISYYLSRTVFADDFLQGDGWKEFVVTDFKTSNRKRVPGVILSNSCDIDPTNARYRKKNILFAPLIPLSRYGKLLENIGKNSNEIAGIFANIRKQYVTDIFYFPEHHEFAEESIIILDDIHQYPLEVFTADISKKKLFTLSQSAFYVFLIKLSIHFTRIQEGVARFE